MILIRIYTICYLITFPHGTFKYTYLSARCQVENDFNLFKKYQIFRHNSTNSKHEIYFIKMLKLERPKYKELDIFMNFSISKFFKQLF